MFATTMESSLRTKDSQSFAGSFRYPPTKMSKKPPPQRAWWPNLQVGTLRKKKSCQTLRQHWIWMNHISPLLKNFDETLKCSVNVWGFPKKKLPKLKEIPDVASWNTSQECWFKKLSSTRQAHSRLVASRILHEKDRLHSVWLWWILIPS